MHAYRPWRVATALVLVASLAACGDSPDRLLARAQQAVSANEPKAAEIHLKNLLQQQERADARLLLGQLHAAAGDWRSAGKEFELALAAGHEPAIAGLGLAESHYQLGEWKKVLERIAALPALRGAEQARAQTLAGRAQLALGDRAAADRAFRAALAAQPEHLPAKAGLITLTAVSDLRSAVAEVDALLAAAPGASEALTLKADIEMAQGRGTQATALYGKVAAAEPQNRTVRAKLAAIASENGDHAGAQRWIDELKKLTGPAVGTMHLQALNDFRQNRNEAARDAILAGLKSAPDHLPSLALSATIHLSLGSLEQAESNARRVLERMPDSTLGYRLLGATYLRMNAPERALQAMKPVLERDQRDPMLLGIAGEAALRLGDAARANGYFSRAAALAPNDATQRTGRGLARLAAGDREGGMADLEQATELSSRGIQADLALIAQHLRERQFDRAGTAIDRLARRQPDHPMIENLRGTLGLARNDLPVARRHFEAALTRNPRDFSAASNLAALDLRERRPEAARQRFTALLDKDPRNIPAMHALATMAQAEDQSPQALAWLTKARDADRASIPATLALARFHLAAGRPKDALPILQEAIGASPEQLELLDALGTAYLNAGDEAQAVLTYDKILRARPDSAPLQMRMGEFRMSRREFERALAHFRKAADLAPQALEARAATASALVALNRVAEARAIAQALQREAPRSPAGLALEADILAHDRRLDEAIGTYRQALALQPSIGVSLRLHRSLQVAERHADADALMRRLLADHPKDVNLKIHAAMLEGARQRWDASARLYREALALQPQNAVALNNLAWALHELRDPAALATAERALELAPKSAAVLDTAGAVLLARGDAARAGDLLRKAVSAAPRVPAYRVRLAEALIAQGDKATARKELDLVLADVRTGPAFEQAQGLMRRL
jgi:putative PEP-CTERM system TPR-repeat lipoprotein